MKHLLIVGAGGFGREMFGAAREAVGYGTEFDIKGFLDARADALAGFQGYPPVVATPDGYEIGPDDVFITALGDIAARRRCAELIERRGGKFIAVVHRTASLGPGVRVGEGSFVAHNVVLTADVAVGRHACVFHNTSIGHDTTLGDFTHVYAQCAIGGAVRIGEGASVYPGARIVPRRTVGDGAVVGIGSVVVLNVPPRTTVFGNPAAPVE
ncbi:MAG: acetyltransferase [Kiritimatiellae bacterium]|nr:acetyltransferase [Kiritimatiellia bacterium]